MKFKCRLCSHIFYSNTVYSTRCPLCKRTHVVRQDEPIPSTPATPGYGRNDADSTIVAPVFDAPSLPSDASSESFSGGGGDSGGGGSSGDWLCRDMTSLWYARFVESLLEGRHMTTLLAPRSGRRCTQRPRSLTKPRSVCRRVTRTTWPQL